MYRNTYVEINLKNIESNVKKLTEKYNNYKYYFGVVKADSYGHGYIKTVKAIINGGCNYLAVATLDEGIEIRKYIKDIPILCLGIVSKEFIEECVEQNITVTISSLEYIEKIMKVKHDNLKVHIKVNTGMNRLGTNNKKELNKIYETIKNSTLVLEGIYTHIYNAESKEDTLSQFKNFEEITEDINLENIPIVHICASDALMIYPKLPYANGYRLGIAMYGLMDNNEIELSSTFSLYSEVIQINEVENGTVGYNGNYKVNGKERIAVIPIGYADGIIRKNTGRNIYINEKEYRIVGNICMDMLFVKVDEDVKVGDRVVIIKDIKHIKEIAKYLDTIPYEVICSVGKRVPRIYIE